jgi:hypothetical protein
VKHEERQFIIGKLTAGQKPDSIAHDLLMMGALEEVERVAQDMAEAEARQKWSREQSCYVIMGPQPKPEIIDKRPGVEVYQTPARQEYRVKVIDFAAFCKEMGLNLAQMTEVVEGKRRDVQDYRCVWTGGNFDMGRAWVDSAPRLNAEQAQRQRREQEGTWKKQSVYSPVPPVIEWTPPEKSGK